jgi:hypothetical protein
MMRRSVITALAVVLVWISGTAAASAQEDTPTPPPDTDCYPLSVFCGFDLQVGPFGPFDFDFLPGGSVFPPPDEPS